MRLLILLCLGWLCQPLEASYFRKPPKGWQCVEDRAQLPGNVLVLYVGEGSTRFSPTIHVASDPLKQNLESYIAGAKKYHERNIEATCHDLGQIQTKSGPARMIQIQSPSVYGEVILLQAYFVQDCKAYVVTGITLKEDFKEFSPLFYETIQTFDVAAETKKG